MILHLDMPSGIAGDMLLAALLDAGGDLARLQTDLALLGVGPSTICAERTLVGGLSALRVDVDAPQEAHWQHPSLTIDWSQGQRREVVKESDAQPAVTVAQEHHSGHRPYRDIRALLARATGLPPRAIARAQEVFRLLAEAEAEVHGTTVDEVEFHEVGAVDAIADIVGCCLLLEQLQVERIVAGPLLPGHGTVSCAHGRMPVPVPAVARMLLRTLPRSGVKPPWKCLSFESGELTTPTGAALVCALADTFREANASAEILHVEALGYGAGHKIIPGLVNVVRVTLCTPQPEHAAHDEVDELTCQVDDATGEHLAHAAEQLLAAGAVDVVLMPVLMKKGRPGHVITVLSRPADSLRLGDLLLTLTPTIGLRQRRCQRRTLPRRTETRVWREHSITCKVVTLPDGSTRMKPEDDEVRAAARATGVAPATIVSELNAARQPS